jgi:predicted RNase H-like HicB family nuclease
MTRYVALLDGEAGAYGVTVPDLPGCTSGGATTDEALRNAVEAVRLWAEDAIADGEELPTPRPAEALRADPEIAAALAEGAALAVVPLLLDAGRPAKANLSLDAGLLAAIDEAAEARGLTARRSGAPTRGAVPAHRLAALKASPTAPLHSASPPCISGCNPIKFSAFKALPYWDAVPRRNCVITGAGLDEAASLDCRQPLGLRVGARGAGVSPGAPARPRTLAGVVEP